MLIISGTAQCTLASDKFSENDFHSFTMFCKNEDLDQQLDTIEAFFVDLGWDNIVIEEAELIHDKSIINNNVLQQAFDKANRQDYSVVVHNTPIAVAA